MPESIVMILDNLDNILQFDLSKEYRIRNYKPNEKTIWSNVLYQSGLFDSYEKALERFELEFKPYEKEMVERCFFIETNSGNVIGTITAWYNSNFNNENYGRIHWVGILPEFQGKGLSKPLLTKAMNKLKQYHHKAYLKTHDDKVVAINLYKIFGFKVIQENK